jgi:hypothetical protein
LKLKRSSEAATQFHVVLGIAPQHALARDGLKLIEAK